MRKQLTIITPTYDYQRFKSVVQRGIASILSQGAHDFDVRHIVVFDGAIDPDFHVDNLPDWYRVEAYETPATNVWGIAQRNFGMSLVGQGWVWFFDHDNILLPSAFSDVSKELDSETGVLIVRAKHIHANEKVFAKSGDKIIPVDLEHSPKYSDIDSLNFIINSSIVGFAEWQEKWGHDFLFVQNIVTISHLIGLRIKRIDVVVGEHS